MFWSAWPMVGGPAGNLLSSGVFALLGLALGEAAFAVWGWRIAFIASAALIVVGVWMRTRVAESPVYQAYVERRSRVKPPALGATLVAHWRSMLIVLLVKAGENAEVRRKKHAPSLAPPDKTSDEPTALPDESYHRAPPV